MLNLEYLVAAIGTSDSDAAQARGTVSTQINGTHPHL